MENTLFGKKWNKENTSVPVNDPEKTNDSTNLNTTLTDLEDFVDSYYDIYVNNTAEKDSYCGDNLDFLQTSQTLLQMDTPLGKHTQTLSSTPQEKSDSYRQRTLDSMILGEAKSQDNRKTKKRKNISPLLMMNLDDVSASDSTDEETLIQVSKSRSLKTPELTMQSHDKTVAAIKSVTESFTQELQGFKTEIKDLITKNKEEDRQLLNTLVAKVDSLTTSVQKKDEEIRNLNASLENAQTKTRVLEGRLTRLEKVVGETREELLQQKARSMKKNLLFYNLAESRGEDVRKVLNEFFMNQLMMPQDLIDSLVIENTHRMGKVNSRRSRPIIVCFGSIQDKIKILRHTKNMDSSQKYSVVEQLPPELNERKRKLWPQYKKAKEESKAAKWFGEKLMVDNKMIEAKPDPIYGPDIDDEMMQQKKFNHTQPKLVQGSNFQGHITDIHDRNYVAFCLQALFMDPRVACATHNIYAYRIASSDGLIEHHEDDGEWSAGRRILRIMKEQSITNKLVVVTRWYGGTHIGPSRFQCIEELTREVCEFKL